MSYRYLDMDEYKRRNHFNYFKSLSYPYVGITVNVRITDFLAVIKEHHLPFFLTFNYYVANAANQIPEFRQRIEGDSIIEFDNCKTSHTVGLEDGTYCYCMLDCSSLFQEYLPRAIQLQEMAKQERICQDQEDVKALIFISSLPWTTYTGLIQPTPIPADSNPRITWGAYFVQDSETFIPVSVLCNHAIVDGLHISKFYEALNKKMEKLTESI